MWLCSNCYEKSNNIRCESCGKLAESEPEVCPKCGGAYQMVNSALCDVCCWTLWARQTNLTWKLAGTGSFAACLSSSLSINNETLVLPPGETPTMTTKGT